MGAELRCRAGLMAETAPIPDGLFCMPGKVVVAVHCTDELEGELETLADSGNRGYTDVGTVIGADHPKYKVGDTVLMLPRWGKYITNFNAGGYIYGCVRFFGDEGKHGICAPYDPDKAFLATVDMDTLTVKPKNQRVIIRRDSYAKTYGALALPDTVGDRTGEAEVMAVDEGITDVPVGARLIYHAGSVDRASVTDELAKKYGGNAKDLAFLPYDAIYSLIER